MPSSIEIPTIGRRLLRSAARVGSLYLARGPWLPILGGGRPGSLQDPLSLENGYRVGDAETPVPMRPDGRKLRAKAWDYEGAFPTW